MIVPEELALGLLLITSAFFLTLTLTSYRRSGVRALLWTSVALAAHVTATFLLVVTVLVNDSIDESTRLYMVLADGVALVLILVLGVVGGKRRG